MKKLLSILVTLVAISLSSCAVGSYSVVSGSADEAAVCFTANKRCDIVVIVDDVTYNMETIKYKTYKSKRNIKKTANNQIILTPGRHEVVVIKDGAEIYNHEIFVSATDLKVIEL